ncbi:MAG: COX15/CtaA family protein, partial [Candidatus Eremiobacteraeota bacterium]|nr:COX15/CtaA family protein [Candidatus Eremiobacteraeota bacterium]
APSSSSASLQTLRYTSLASAIFAFALVVWGGIVRINGAGMTCPDWPRCRGAWFPALHDPVVFEWTHRLGAPVLTLLIIATFVAAWRARRERPAAWRAAWLAAGLLVAQIIVGALTIKYINNPPSVAAHLGVGIATFVSLLLVWYTAARAPAETQPEESAVAERSASTASAHILALVFARLALSAAIVTFGAILAAGYMSASNDGLACTQFPLCNGWGPPENVAQQIHMGHRVLAYISFFLIIIIAASGGRTRDLRIRAFSLTALGLGALQVALGVSTIVSGLAPALRSIHQANGALLFACLVLLTYEAYDAAAPEAYPQSASGTSGRAVVQHP